MNDTATAFATLFAGGAIATDTADGFRPLEDAPPLLELCRKHLSTVDAGIGVYPLYGDETDDGVVYRVNWGCVDFDEGEDDSRIHADNLELVLHRLGVKGWVERSRSKGYHVWVFFSEPLLARSVREGLIGVCSVVDAPIKEVNPKQIELTGKGWGNGVRLPYPFFHAPGRNVVLSGGVEMTPESFASTALSSRCTPEAWKAVRAVYKPPEPPPPRNVYQYGGGTLEGLAGAIRRGGPRPIHGKPEGDRSSTLFNLACAMVRQGYDNGAIMKELESADEDWGAKYAKRLDGRQRLWETVVKASRVAGVPNRRPPTQEEPF